jgi:hypothetical protein
MNGAPGLQRLLPGAAVLSGGLALAFGAVGLAWAVPENTRTDWAKLLFETAGLLFLQSPDLPSPPSPDNWAFAAARVFATVAASLGITGFLLQLHRPASDALIRLAFRFSRQPPAVVFGLGRVGGPVARHLREAGRPVYAVTVNEDTPFAVQARQCGALVLVGDATTSAVRRGTRLADASEAFIATGDDARNLALAGELLSDLNSGQIPLRQKLRCYVHVSSPTLTASLAEHRWSQAGHRNVSFQIFNVDEQDARDGLLSEGRGLLRGQSSDAVAHFIVIGFGVSGQAMALQMARLAHFRSFARPRLTIVDHFGGEQARFLERHPGFCPDPAQFDLRRHGLLDRRDKDAWGCRAWRPADPAWRSTREEAVEYAVNAEFLDLTSDASVPRTMREPLLDRLWPASSRSEPAIQRTLVVCFDDEQRNFETALWLRELLEAESLERGATFRLPLYVHLPTARGLARVLESSADFAESAVIDLWCYGGSEPSDAYDRIARPRLLDMARVVQKRYNDSAGGGPDFDDLSPAFQASNIDAAAHADLKIDAIGYRRRPQLRGEQTPPLVLSGDQLAMLAHMEHNRWMAERLTIGWRFGEKQTARRATITQENRRRLSLVPWERLSVEQRREMEKDVAQVMSLPDMYAAAGDVLERQDQTTSGRSSRGD